MKSRCILVMTVMATLCVVLFSFGCGTLQSSSMYEIPPEEEEVSTLNQRVNWADVIVRATLASTRAAAYSPDWTSDYVGAVEFSFNVSEYLKGTGPTSITVIATDYNALDGATYSSESDAEERGEELKKAHDTTWDDREALLFLLSEAEAGHYWIGVVGVNQGESYAITADHHIVWLPEALDTAPGTRTNSSEQYFLTDVSSATSSLSETRSNNGQREEPSVALSFIKGRISAIANEIAAGDGSEAYELCVKDKYRWEGSALQQLEFLGDVRYFQKFYPELISNKPAGTEIYRGGHYLTLTEEEIQNQPADADGFVVISGPDKDLFAKGWPLTVLTVRPLPAGEYRFYHAERGRIQIPCDAMPELHRTRFEIILTVTAPEGTLHETMFDPATLTEGVGVDGTTGVISAADLTVDGTSTSISELKWHNDQVVLSWSAHTDLAEHTLEFIELDGSIGLSLAGPDAAEDSAAKTLTWEVSGQPWEAGDMLMLRIDGTGE